MMMYVRWEGLIEVRLNPNQSTESDAVTRWPRRGGDPSPPRSLNFKDSNCTNENTLPTSQGECICWGHVRLKCNERHEFMHLMFTKACSRTTIALRFSNYGACATGGIGSNSGGTPDGSRISSELRNKCSIRKICCCCKIFRTHFCCWN